MRTLPAKLKKATSTPKGRIILLSILIFILAAVAGGITWWNIYRKQIIRSKLEDTVHEKTKGLYALKYDKLNLDEVAGDLSVTNLVLAYDSIKYDQLLKNNDAPAILVTVSIPSISVSGVKTPRALLSKEIVGKKILISNPVINVIYTNGGKDSTRNIPDKAIYEQVLGDLNLIKVDTLEITGAQISTSHLKTGKKDVEITNSFIRLMDVAVDSAAGSDTTRMLFSRQIDFTCEKIAWSSKNKLYKYSADSVSLNSAAGSVLVKKFSIDPTVGEDAFVKRLPTQDDRFDFSINAITIRNVDMPGLFNEQLIADSVLINSASFKIYRDISLTRDKKNRVGSYPQQSIDNIPIPVHVKKIILANTFIEYKEKNPRSNQAGKVQFYNTHATITNLTNDKNVVKKNNIMTADVTTRFLNKAALKVVWQFYLQHPRGKFDVRGNLSGMNLTDANSITEPMGPARLEDGKLNSLQFNLAGHDYGMNGTVKMLYEDLKVSILAKDKDSKELDKKGLASVAANFIIKNNNPSRRKDEPRIIEVEMERDTNRSMFYLVWKTLFKGIKETAGIKK